MKKASIVIGSLIVAILVFCFAGLGGAEDRPAAAKEAMLAKEAVSKVLGAHSFTPPIVLPGPQGSVWYVSSRTLAAHSVEQAVVGVRGGNKFTVELSAFRREREQDPWAALNKTSTPGIGNMERSIQEQLQKELAGEEKGTTPAKPDKEDKAK